VTRHPTRTKMAALVVLASALCTALGRSAEPVSLRDNQIALDVDSDSGAILRLVDVPTGIALAPPAALAGSFRLALQLPDGPAATIVGRDQTAPVLEQNGSRVSISWESPLRDTAGTEHQLAARMDVTVSDGAAAFVLHVDNNSTGRVVEAWYPLIGGLMGLRAPDAKPDASLWIPTSIPWEKSISTPFEAAVFGYPGQMNMSFACVRSESAGRSLYLASQDPVARYKTYRFTEFPDADDSDVFASIVHVPFTPSGQSFDGSPVVLRFVEGDWRAAGHVYREWFVDTFGLARPEEDWIRQQSFFLMTMFMLPEGTINFTFRDIPRWARSAKRHGLEAVQISGWQQGGHDNGYPDYTIDPRLGTWDELAAGIRACHNMGLKVYFFVNYQPMMVDSSWYKDELSRYREMRADGGHTWMAGWGMGTLWARMGHSKLMTWADLGFPEYRRIIVDQFARLAEIGADGVQVDKMFPSAVDHNPDIPLSPDTSTWQGAILLTQEIMSECRRHNPDWAMSFECSWDRMLQFGCATWWVGNQLITRQVFPENAETLGLYQAYDYLGVNNAVRDGHIVMVAPMNFSRSLDWPPFRGLAGYIREVKHIRDRLQETVFFGEVLGAAGVTLEGADQAGLAYNTFRNREDGHRVCILTNSRLRDREVTLRAFKGSTPAMARIHAPFSRRRLVALPAKVTVPAERLVFVEEVRAAR